MKKIVFLLLMTAVVCFGAEPKEKFAIILQSGNETNEGAARAMHALLYAQELAESGYKVALIFDGAGAGWAVQFRDPAHPMNKAYLSVVNSGTVLEICDHCAENFNVKDQLSEQQRNFLSGDYKGHPSLVRFIQQGYQLLIL
ncbi:DsrE family protein [Pontiellaceae bacterium B12219]|nr:DsrE family protein [Pontiellaceae bacterium B12219]